MRLAVLLLAAALGGCVSQAEMRAAKPSSVGDIAGSYRDVASCTLDQLNTRYGDSFNFVRGDQPKARTAFIDAKIRSWTGGDIGHTNYEVAFIQSDAEKVHVEVKSLGTIWGGRQHPDDLWPIIKSCAT